MNQTYLSSTKITVLSLKPSKAICLLVMVLFVFITPMVSFGQTSQTFTISDTFVVPPGVTSVKVEAWGAGAGGQGGVGGGGGGAFAGNNSVPVTPGLEYTIIVGIGGGIGAFGGNSSIALKTAPTVFLVMAEGGGKAGITLTGGRASAPFSIGSAGLVWSGGNGILGTFNGGGGGGGSAGAGGAGGAGSDSVGDNGGIGGIGGAAGTGTAGATGGRGGSKDSKFRDGGQGNTPGGGGGEKYYKEGKDANSGSGGNGQVIISYCSASTTWNATNGVGSWSDGIPTKDKNLVFNGDYPPTIDPNVDIEGCSCQVNALADVIIKTGRKMTITNGVNVIANGFLTFEDNSSLVQINNASNINKGDIDYIRTTDTGIYNTDYIYWSSPVKGMTLGKVSKNLTSADKYYSYKPTLNGEDWEQESSSTPMVSGNGYIIRGPEYSASIQPGNKYTATFTGVPNNGPYEITSLLTNKSYLLGNPYPSALDADTFLSKNAAVLNGTLYFWTHNTDMQARGIIASTAGSGAFAYTSNDYATYNATGGVGASQPDSGAVTGGAPVGPNPRGDNNANPPSGKIASGQGFFASTKTAITGSKIIYDNTMRVGVNGITGNNSQFFKTKDLKGKTANTIEKNRLWLNLTNTEGAFKQTLIGYITDATNDYDDRFDGESFDGNEFVDFYSVNQDKNLVIQGRALPFEETDEVQLGFRTTIDGNFTINIDQVDGSMTDQAVFIEDKLTNTVFNLKTGNYNFSTTPGTFNDRFVLRYNNKTLGAENYDSPAHKVIVSNANKQIKINSFAEMIDKVVIYDLLGRQVFQKANVNNNELSIVNLISSNQTLVIKTLLQNGNAITKKIIY